MNDRLPGTPWSNPIWYGRWRIYLGEGWPGCEWAYSHDDYDGACDAGDSRCGHCVSIAVAKVEIDEMTDGNIDN